MSINNISPELFGLLSALVGIGIASDLDDEAQNVIGNFLSAAGQVILTVAAQKQNIESFNEENEKEKLLSRVDKLEEQIKSMQSMLERLNMGV